MSLIGGRAPAIDPIDPDLPAHLLAVNTGHWTDLIWRLKISPKHKAGAMALAFHADPDGTNVYPGNWRIADMLNVDESNATPVVKDLESWGLLYLVKRGGGRWATDADQDDDERRPSNEYRLTRPADLASLPLWLDPTMRRYVPRPKRSRKSKAKSPVIDPTDRPADRPERQADSPVIPQPEAVVGGTESQAQTPVIHPADQTADRTGPSATGPESQAKSPVIPSESQAESPVIDGKWQVDSPVTGASGPVDNSDPAGMTGDSGPNDRRSDAEWQATPPPYLFRPPLHPTPRVVTLGDQLTSVAPDRDRTAEPEPAIPGPPSGGPLTGPDRTAVDGPTGPRPGPLPCIGAVALDRGPAAATATPAELRVELAAARAVVDPLPWRERLLEGARNELTRDGHEPRIELVIIAAAELYRRAQAEHTARTTTTAQTGS